MNITKKALLAGMIALFIFFSGCKNNNEFSNKEHVSLRAEYKEINEFKEIRDIINKYDFFDRRKNRSGNFQGRLEEHIISGNSVVLDLKTGLMWMAQDKNDPDWIKAENNIDLLKTYPHENAGKMIDKLNKSEKGYAGFKDWRLPTVEEAASLLRKQRKPNSLCFPDIFSKKNTLLLYIWTGDYYNLTLSRKKNMIWTVSFAAGGIFRESHKNPQYLRLVRRHVQSE